jgi:transketolase
MHTIKPLDTEAVLRAVTETRRLIVFEEHNVLGGLGSAVAEVIADNGKGCAFKRVGIPDCFCEVGYPEDLYTHYKLDADGILETVRQVMKMDFEEDEDWEDEV